LNLILKASDYRQGLWRNGLGVSWDIAQQGGEDFDWRMAIARLDADVPFSAYPDVDRVFTIIEGKGVSLDIDGTGFVEATRLHPVYFPGDRQTSCRLLSGPCRALNLFVKRGRYAPAVAVTCHGKGDEFPLAEESLVFVIDGVASIDGEDMERDDSAVVKTPAALRIYADTVLWRAELQAGNSH
jgi:environmental stress-induced protein Ves